MSQPGVSPSPFRVIDLIRKKRDGGALSAAEIGYLVAGCTKTTDDGGVPDYQMAAWLMAVVLRGMSREETASLTDAMLRSGEVLDLSSFLPARKVDKHSTGGVGDKTSLVIAPVVVAAGILVPMISGRGLGIQAAPSISSNPFPDSASVCPCLSFIACSRLRSFMIGQTEKIAPADRKLTPCVTLPERSRVRI